MKNRSIILKNISIKAKVIYVIVASLLIINIAFAINLKRSYDFNIHLIDVNSVRDANAAFNNLKEGDIKKLSATLEAVLAINDYKKPFELRQRAELLKLATPMFKDLKEQFGITNWSFLNLENVGTTFLRVHSPKTFNDSCMNRITYQNAVKTKTFSSGIEQGNIDVGLRVDHPWYDKDKLIGYIELTEGMNDFLDRMKKQTSNDYALLIGKSYLNEKNWAEDRKLKGIDNRWNDLKDAVLVGETPGSRGLVDFNENIADLPEGGEALGEIHRGGFVYVRGVFPIYDAGNRKIGAVFIIQNVTQMYKALTSDFEKTIIFLLILMVLLSFGMIEMLNTLILHRLQDMIEKVTRLVGGDFYSPIVSYAHDEVGRFESLLEKFRVIFIDVLKELENGVHKDKK